MYSSNLQQWSSFGLGPLASTDLIYKKLRNYDSLCIYIYAYIIYTCVEFGRLGCT